MLCSQRPITKASTHTLLRSALCQAALRHWHEASSTHVLLLSRMFSALKHSLKSACKRSQKRRVLTWSLEAFPTCSGRIFTSNNNSPALLHEQQIGSNSRAHRGRRTGVGAQDGEERIHIQSEPNDKQNGPTPPRVLHSPSHATRMYQQRPQMAQAFGCWAVDADEYCKVVQSHQVEVECTTVGMHG